MSTPILSPSGASGTPLPDPTITTTLLSPPSTNNNSNPLHFLSPASNLATSKSSPRVSFHGLNPDDNVLAVSSKTFHREQEPSAIRTTVTVEEIGKALGRYTPRTRNGKRKQGFLNYNGFQMHQPTLRYRCDASRTSSTLYGRGVGCVSPYDFQAYIDPIVRKKFEEAQRLKKLALQREKEQKEKQNKSLNNTINNNNNNSDNYQEEDEDDDAVNGSGSLIDLAGMKDEAETSGSPEGTGRTLTRFPLVEADDTDPDDYVEINGPSAPLLGPYYTSLFRDVCNIVGYDYKQHQLSCSSTPPSCQPFRRTSNLGPQAAQPSSRATGANEDGEGDSWSGDDICPHAATSITPPLTPSSSATSSSLSTTTSTQAIDLNSMTMPTSASGQLLTQMAQTAQTRRTCRLCRIEATQHQRPEGLPPALNTPLGLTPHQAKIGFTVLSHRIRRVDFNANRALMLKHTLSRGFALSVLRHPQAVLVPTHDYDTVAKWLWIDQDGVQLLWGDKPPVLDKKPNFFKKLFHLSNAQHTSSQELLRVERVILGIFQRGKNSHKKSVLKPWHCITIYFNNTQPKAEKSYEYHDNTDPKGKRGSTGSSDGHSAMGDTVLEKLEILDPIEIVCHDDDQTRRVFMALQALSPLSSSTKSYGSFLWKRASLKMRKLAFDKVLLKEEFLQQLWEQAKQFKYERFKKQYMLMKKVNALRFVIAQTSMLCASQIYYEFLNTLLTSHATNQVLKLAATHASAELQHNQGDGNGNGSSQQHQGWVVRSRSQKGFFELDWGRLDQLFAMASNSIKETMSLVNKRNNTSNRDGDQGDDGIDQPESTATAEQKAKLAKWKTAMQLPAELPLDPVDLERVLIKKNQIADLLEMCLVRLFPLNQSLSMNEVVMARYFLKVYIRRRLVTSMIEKTHEALTPRGDANERQTLRYRDEKAPILFGIEPNQGQQLHLDSPALEKLSSIASINVTPLLDDNRISLSTTNPLNPPGDVVGFHGHLANLNNGRAMSALPYANNQYVHTLAPIQSPGVDDGLPDSPTDTLGDQVIIPEDLRSPAPLEDQGGPRQDHGGIFESRKNNSDQKKSNEFVHHQNHYTDDEKQHLDEKSSFHPPRPALSDLSTISNINASVTHNSLGRPPSPVLEFNPCDVVDAFNEGLTVRAEELRQQNKENFQIQRKRDEQALQQAQDFTNLEFGEQYNAQEYETKVKLLRDRREKMKGQKTMASESKSAESKSNLTTTPSTETTKEVDSTNLLSRSNSNSAAPETLVLSEQQQVFLAQFPSDVINLIQEQISDLLDMDRCRLLPTADDGSNTLTSPSASAAANAFAHQHHPHNHHTTHNSQEINNTKLSIPFHNLPPVLVGDTTAHTLTLQSPSDLGPVVNVSSPSGFRASVNTGSGNTNKNRNQNGIGMTSPSFSPSALPQHPERQKMMRQLQKLSYELQKQLTLDSTSYLAGVENDDDYGYSNHREGAARLPADSDAEGTIPSYRNYLQLHRTRKESLAILNGAHFPSPAAGEGRLIQQSDGSKVEELKEKMRIEEEKNTLVFQQQHPQQKMVNTSTGFNLALATLQSKIGLDSHGLREYDLDSVEFLHHCYRFQLEQVNMGRENRNGVGLPSGAGPNQTRANQLFENGTHGSSSSSLHSQTSHQGPQSGSGPVDDKQQAWMLNPQALKHSQLIKTNPKVIEFIAYLRAAMYPHLTGFEEELIHDGAVDLELLCGELLALSPDTIDQLQNDQDGVGCQFIGFTRRK